MQKILILGKNGNLGGILVDLFKKDNNYKVTAWDREELDVTDRDNTTASCSTTVTVEVAGAPQCSDGIDNDQDGLTDFPADPGCDNAADNDETDAPAVSVQAANAAADCDCLRVRNRADWLRERTESEVKD